MFLRHSYCEQMYNPSFNMFFYILTSICSFSLTLYQSA
nr:MAG TPA: hypothetical protein [Caudoviricetes sp.]